MTSAWSLLMPKPPPLDVRSHAPLFAALLLASAIACGMLMLRAVWGGGTGYSSLVWNLFLAWLPYFFALRLAAADPHSRPQWVGSATLAALWLLFFPNAPYLITDLIHLHPSHAPHEHPIALLAGVSRGQEIPVWFDALLVFAFAWTGVLLAFASLDLVRRKVARLSGDRWGWAVASAAIVLCSFGVALGRFERFNSWDVLTQPQVVLPAVLARMANPLGHMRTTVVTVLLTTFLSLGYVTVLALARTQREPSRHAHP
jgi:uncharacterized membrane protein